MSQNQNIPSTQNYSESWQPKTQDSEPTYTNNVVSPK